MKISKKSVSSKSAYGQESSSGSGTCSSSSGTKKGGCSCGSAPDVEEMDLDIEETN